MQHLVNIFWRQFMKNNLNDLEAQTIKHERMQKYVEEMRMLAIKEMENKLSPQPFQSSFKDPSETTYMKYLMCPRILLLSENNLETSKYFFQLANYKIENQFKLTISWINLKTSNDRSIAIQNLSFVHLENKNRICIQFKDQSAIYTIHIQLNTERKQAKYFEALNFLLENKFFL